MNFFFFNFFFMSISGLDTNKIVFVDVRLEWIFFTELQGSCLYNKRSLGANLQFLPKCLYKIVICNRPECLYKIVISEKWC